MQNLQFCTTRQSGERCASASTLWSDQRSSRLSSWRSHLVLNPPNRPDCPVSAEASEELHHQTVPSTLTYLSSSSVCTDFGQGPCISPPHTPSCLGYKYRNFLRSRVNKKKYRLNLERALLDLPSPLEIESYFGRRILLDHQDIHFLWIGEELSLKTHLS